MRISVVTPVFDETDSVIEIVDGLKRLLGSDLLEIIAVISPRSSAASFAACLGESRKAPGLVKVVLQKGPRGIGIPYREGISYSRGTHILCIDSDGEMDLATAGRMRDLMRERPELVLVAAARWAKGGGFSGYGKAKLPLNWGYQKLFRWLFWTPLHDLTYGYKMLRADIAQRLPFTGVRHEFACEGTLLPVRLGLPVAEIASRWTKRKAGVSKNRFIDNFRYVAMAWRLRTSRPRLLDAPRRAEPEVLDPEAPLPVVAG